VASCEVSLVNLAEMSITVRERSMAELYDLAVLVMRRHIGDLLLLSLLVGTPMTLLNWWLLSGFHPGAEEAWFPWLLLLSVEAPLYGSVVTAFLGQAMFSRQVSKRSALRQALSRAPGLVAGAAVRGILTLIPVLLLWYPAQLTEVLVLERLKGSAAWRRAWQLGSFYRGENVLHLLMNVVVGAVLLGMVLGGGFQLLSILQLGIEDLGEPAVLFHPSQPWVLAACCPILTFCATLRFCSYLDLRTKREGWEVELELRTSGQRLREGRL
jgi:hypothetical protein